MRDLDGHAISSDSLRGKVTIVNFWATWCPPCRAEIPDLIALQEKYRDQLQVIGVSQDEVGPEAVRRFAAEQHMNYPIVMSTPEIEKIFTGIYALPTSFIVDRTQQIVQKHVGMLNASTTEAEARYLSGLDTNVSVERVEDETKALIKNAAQATEDSRRRSRRVVAGGEGRSSEAAQRGYLHVRVRPHAGRLPHQRSRLQFQPAARAEDRRRSGRASPIEGRIRPVRLQPDGH